MDRITYCDVNTCEDCPKYGDDCDGSAERLYTHEEAWGMTDLISRADAVEDEMNREIIKDILKMMPTAYLLEALGVDTVDELMKPAETHEIRTETHGVCLISKSADAVQADDRLEPNKIYCSPLVAENVEVVVRCKDCMHRHEYECPMYHEEWFTIDEGDGYVDDDYTAIDKTVDDGFCQCGERREP